MKLMQIFSQIDVDIGTGPDQINIPQTTTGDSTITTVLSLVFGVMGAVAFLIIVVAGLRFTLSRGDPGALNKARNTIIYAAVGLVLAMLAFTIVRFTARNI